MVTTRLKTGTVTPKKYLGEEEVEEGEPMHEEGGKLSVVTPKKRGRAAGVKRTPGGGKAKGKAAKREDQSGSDEFQAHLESEEHEEEHELRLEPEEEAEEEEAPSPKKKRGGGGRGRGGARGKKRGGGRGRGGDKRATKKAKTAAAEAEEGAAAGEQQPTAMEIQEAAQEPPTTTGGVAGKPRRARWNVVTPSTTAAPTPAPEEGEQPYPPEPEHPVAGEQEPLQEEEAPLGMAAGGDVMASLAEFGEQMPFTTEGGESEVGGEERMEEAGEGHQGFEDFVFEQQQPQQGGNDTGGGSGGQGVEATQAATGTGSDPSKASVGVIEEGSIYFFYRPKVSVEEAASISDVQRFYMLLQPTGGSSGSGGGKVRLAIVGKKRLPDIDKNERFFGFIDAVDDSFESLVSSKLSEQTYETKTRGTRSVAAARVVGQGGYSIVQHEGKDHVHLVYRLEVPSEPGTVQSDFNISKEGSFIFSVKNPQNQPPAPNLGLPADEKADFPQEKKQEFGDYAWIPAHDPQLLNYERCEFLLVGAAEDVGKELGSTAQQAQQAADDKAKPYTRTYCPDEDEECMLEELKKEVNVEKTGVEMEPVETGEWK